MQKVENGKFVCVDYKGTLDNGDVFDSSEGREPMEVLVGGGQVIKGFEEALMDMTVNEKKVFTIEPDAAYGHRDEDRMHTFPRKEIPADLNPEVGQLIGLQTPDGQQVPARIAEADDAKVVVDLNHPLAGETLTFEVEVVGISDTPTQSPQGCGGGCDCSSAGCAC
jgi:peptidylprolyl isomerase